MAKGLKGTKKTRARHPEVIDRIRRVGDMLAAGTPRREIIATLSDTWGVSESTIANYMTEIFVEWKAQAERDKPFCRDYYREQMQKFYDEAKRNGEWRAAATILDRMCKLDDVYSPDKMQIQGTVGVGLDVNPADPESVRKRILDLLENPEIQAKLAKLK